MADYKSIMKKIKKALISVSDKKDLGLLLKKLTKFKVDIISSGGTYKEIKKLGLGADVVSKGELMQAIKFFIFVTFL